MPSQYLKKDGTVKKIYVSKLWNHVIDSAIDSFNQDLNDEQLQQRIQQFQDMINELLSYDQ